MKYLIPSFSLFLLFTLSTSCVKEELISEEYYQDFELDTVFFMNPGLDSFHLLNPEDPVTADGFIYLPVLEETGSTDFRIKLLKMNLETGEVIWTFDRFDTGDNGFPNKISSIDGLLLYETSTRAYVIDNTLGNAIFTYEPADSIYFRGAAINDYSLYVSVYNHEHGAWLQQVNLNTGTAVSVKHLGFSEYFYPIPGKIHFFDHNNQGYLAWDVVNLNGDEDPISLFYAPVTAFHDFRYLPLGAASGGGALSTRIIADTNSSDDVAVFTSNGLLNSYDFWESDQLQWSHKGYAASNLYHNSRYFYLSPSGHLGGYSILDKKTGEVRASNPNSSTIRAVNDYAVLTTGYSSLRFLRPSDGQLLREFSFDGYLDLEEVFGVGDDSFIFYSPSGNGKIGKLRLKPIVP